MALERDNAAERLAKIDVQLTEAKRTIQRLKPTDLPLVQDLRAKLDGWLQELRGLTVRRQMKP